MQLQYLEALKQVGASPASKVVVPMELSGLVAAFTAAGSSPRTDRCRPGADRQRSAAPRASGNPGALAGVRGRERKDRPSVEDRPLEDEELVGAGPGRRRRCLRGAGRALPAARVPHRLAVRARRGRGGGRGAGGVREGVVRAAAVPTGRAVPAVALSHRCERGEEPGARPHAPRRRWRCGRPRRPGDAVPSPEDASPSNAMSRGAAARAGRAARARPAGGRYRWLLGLSEREMAEALERPPAP